MVDISTSETQNNAKSAAADIIHHKHAIILRVD